MEFFFGSERIGHQHPHLPFAVIAIDDVSSRIMARSARSWVVGMFFQRKSSQQINKLVTTEWFFQIVPSK